MAAAEAIILAGGLGTRLRSVVPDLPKCMAPVAGRPFLYYVLRYCQSQGIKTFIFSLGHLHEIVTRYLAKEFAALHSILSVEEEPLGTGGAIQQACGRAAGNTVLVLNGDTFFDIDVGQLLAFHDRSGAHCTLSLKPMQPVDRYGSVMLNQDDSVRSFQEKKFYASGLINGGLYALDVQKFLDKSLPDKFSFEKDYLEKYVAERSFYGLAQDRYFIDIGIPSDYERAQQEIKDRFTKSS